MQRVHFIYNVVSEVRFTEEEVKILIRGACRHYDTDCRLSAAPAGLLGIMHWGFTVKEVVLLPFQLTIGDLDLLTKVAEPFSGSENDKEHTIYLYLRALLQDALKESARLNAHLVKEKG